jgi:uncharacterized repeat protein (TIGR03803 family)
MILVRILLVGFLSLQGAMARGEDGLTITNAVEFPGGYYPAGGAIQARDGTFYCVYSGGGDFHKGAVLRIGPDRNPTILMSFDGTNGFFPTAPPVEGPDGALYGTTEVGGEYDLGTVFRISTNGDLVTLFSFNGTNGALPDAELIFGADGNLYGTTSNGGSNTNLVFLRFKGFGTIFRMTPEGEHTLLASFDGTNGSSPLGRLLEYTNGVFFGTTWGGGVSNRGTVFRYSSARGLETMVLFNGTNGAKPFAGLVAATDGWLYGTTRDGGTNHFSKLFKPDNPENYNGDGTIFRIHPEGEFQSLHSLSFTNGAHPCCELVQDDTGTFWGTTMYGGGNWLYPVGPGTIFRIGTNGAYSTVIKCEDVGTAPLCGFRRTIDGSLFAAAQYGSDRGGSIFNLVRAVPPKILSVLPGNYSGDLTFDGTPGQTYVVEMATSLKEGNWSGVQYAPRLKTNVCVLRIGFTPTENQFFRMKVVP